MDLINSSLGTLLGWLMSVCYALVSNYGIAILFFTVLTKLVLLPISVWVHKNGIKVVRLQPELNRLKANYFGDADRIAEETSILYKREKYNPFASLIPLFIQIILLMGLISVIYHPLDNLLHFDPTITEALIQQAAALTGMDPATASIQLSVVDAMKNPANEAAFLAVPGMGLELLESVRSLNMGMFGISLAQTPVFAGGVLWLLPLLAGAAAFLLCVVQNRLNPLQAEQGKWGKAGTMAVSVGISLFLGAFVPAGVGFYWICSNLLTILQQLALNKIIDPKKYIDYAALERSKQALEGLQEIGGQKKWFQRDPNARREKEDYKRFFSIANKHLVFYSEKSGFYKYFESVIEYLLSHSNLVIHYITSDPDDAVFGKAREYPKIKPYYIGEKKLITLMMKMDADMVIMTMPDLDNFHIKRSYVRKDIEYVYMFHGLLVGMRTLRPGALDHFDTCLCVSETQAEEIRKIEQDTGAKQKKLIACGYGVLDKMAAEYDAMPQKLNRKILIAPSWQENNILESCLPDLAELLVGAGYDVTIRPHPQYGKRFPQKLKEIINLCESWLPSEHFRFQNDFASNKSVFEACLLITDWSSIGFEYALSTCKPALFIDTPMKVVNSELKDASDNIPPLDIMLRNVVGKSMKPEQIPDKLISIVTDLLSYRERYKEKIVEVRTQQVAHFGESGQYCGKYILDTLRGKKYD